MEANLLAPTRGALPMLRSRKLLAPLGDDRLVEQLRRGNDAAFEVLYDRHHRGVLSYCRHTLGTLDEAEDAVQQAFVSAHADLVSSSKPIHFKAWIYTIARNRCLSMLRARREQPSDDLEVVSTAGLGDEVQQRADLQELLADMHELPEDQRAALIFSELGDLSHIEVAEVIGCEASKVKSLVFQARSGLIERRAAREAPCEEIREQLATLRGGSLRRGPLRRHLKACPGCAEFRAEVKQQRQMFAAVLPVIPTLGLRESALAAVGIGGTTAAGGGAVAAGTIGAAAAAKAGVAKVALIAVATGSAAVGGGVAADRLIVGGGESTKPAAVQPESPAGAGAAGTGGEVGAADNAREKPGNSNAAPGNEKSREARDGKGRGRSEEAKAQHKPAGKGRGHAPRRGSHNGAGVRGFAGPRGNRGQQNRGQQKGRQNAPGSNRPQPQPQRGSGNAKGPAPVTKQPASPGPREKAQPVQPVAPPPPLVEEQAPRSAPKAPVEAPQLGAGSGNREGQ